ncbi:iron export ABC transporter permease subunit FetB [Phytoactinopolyspora alkaliphila]|uniref:Iron export ABC transporter permease subunit FetB n=1 Tax=Phytoactinopolyspora alkaliphila TaxID=1783498 RepID=A0A6N9YTZ2_9ACTN|nr:iron export ABC transporter permease subunit FetB [Phytoactinopolyspora alkaliphila]NED98516.1 iron export ABC transporter permease subunit FetB [Phytoactinopolyspora alkaliphila]
MNGDVSYAGLATSLALVGVAAVISLWQRLGLERQILWAAARALVQLLLVGAALALVIEPGRPLVWSWLWVSAMVAYAGDVARRRAPEVPGVMALAVGAFAIAAVISLGVLFGFGVLPLEGRTLVPVAGMLVGNSMTATVLVARRLVEELRDKRDEVEARLALGQPSQQASTPYVRAALRSAVSPQIETTKATGLVFLPGAMTGLILAGVPPTQAVLVQAVVMFLILGSVATTAVVMALGLARRLFTSDHRLRWLPRSADVR